KDESGGVMVSIFIGFLVLLLSGLFYPVEFLPKIIKYFTMILPTSLHVSLLNNALIFNASFAEMSLIFSNGLIYLGALAVLCFYLMLKPVQ
ncbi:MAG: hypothetical protein PHT91_03710, partial [Candidatus Nanoarchaeia archaeon]|nr:hypothetical protein [Candidatus Nanoarchaeia archaeon]